MAMADALKSNRTLQVLNLAALNSSIIHNDGVSRIARALEANAALTRLILSDNVLISCVGATELGG